MQEINLSNIPKIETENHTSKGNQPKWHINNKWYKADHMGYEALTETVISELLLKSNVENFVRYNLIKINHNDKQSIGCVSENFKPTNEMLVPIEKLHRQYFGRSLADALSEKLEIKDKIIYTVNFIENITELNNVGRYFSVLLSIDAFFLNEDRHTNNIAVLRDENTKKYKLAPIFDNGLALLSDINDYAFDKDVFDNIKRVKAKPFDENFDIQLEAAEELYGCHLKFNFKNKDIREILEKYSSFYDKQIISRVENILYEQMRKYQYLF